jgi:cryptochrome
VFKDWSISQLCFELDTEPYARSRDATVRQLAAAAGVEVKSPVSHTLYVSVWRGVRLLVPHPSASLCAC